MGRRLGEGGSTSSRQRHRYCHTDCPCWHGTVARPHIGFTANCNRRSSCRLSAGGTQGWLAGGCAAQVSSQLGHAPVLHTVRARRIDHIVAAPSLPAGAHKRTMGWVNLQCDLADRVGAADTGQRCPLVHACPLSMPTSSLASPGVGLVPVVAADEITHQPQTCATRSLPQTCNKQPFSQKSGLTKGWACPSRCRRR